MRTSRQEQHEWMERFRSSGLRMRAFAREHGLIYHRLVYWVAQDNQRQRRQQEELAAPDDASNELVPLATWLGRPSYDGCADDHVGVSVQVGVSRIAFCARLDPTYVEAVIREAHPMISLSH